MDDLFHVIGGIVLITTISIFGYNYRQSDKEELELKTAMARNGCSQELSTAPGGYTYILWKCPQTKECR